MKIESFHFQIGTLYYLLGTDRGFAHVDGSFEDYKAKRFSKDWTGAYVAENFNQAIADETIAWMGEVRVSAED